MDGERFCTRCGARLQQDAKYCPECGTEVGDNFGTWPSGPEPEPANPYNAILSAKLKKVETLCVIWGILALIIGIFIVLDAEGLTDSFIDQMKDISYDDHRTYWDYAIDNGIDRDTVLLLYALMGGTLAASGFAALVTAHFAHRQEMYTVALVMLIISTILAASGLFTFLVGIFVTYSLTKCKPVFKT